MLLIVVRVLTSLLDPLNLAQGFHSFGHAGESLLGTESGIEKKTLYDQDKDFVFCMLLQSDVLSTRRSSA